MKQVFPQVRPRRLGTRGNSRYCYAGLKKRLKLEEPDTMESTDDKNIQVCIILFIDLTTILDIYINKPWYLMG